MIDIFVADSLLLLRYVPERVDPLWILRKFRRGESVSLRQTFTLTANDLMSPLDINLADDSDEPDEYLFRIGEASEGYLKLSSSVFGTENTFHFHEDIPMSPRLFVAHRNVAVLPKIDRLVSEDVYVGGDRTDAMPATAYADLIDRFPNSYELTKYAAARVGSCVRDYFDTATDSEVIFQRYMNRRIPRRGSGLFVAFREGEVVKYRALHEKLLTMLSDEPSYSESQWQLEILDIIRLLYPKYIHVFKEAPVWDSIAHKQRYIDLLLVDSCGHVDIIEIKKPFDNCIVSKWQYRDNFIPLKELTGTIMQVEKYILYLNKWGQRGEEKLSQRYKDVLPNGFRLKITNPKGIVIMGREEGLSDSQLDDFEVIKRKYSNVLDIVTYDNLLARLSFTIDQLTTQ